MPKNAGRRKDGTSLPLLIKWQELNISFQAAGALDSCTKYYLLPREKLL